VLVHFDHVARCILKANDSVYDETGNVIETHEHTGNFREF
jgi:hypothetical protein